MEYDVLLEESDPTRLNLIFSQRSVKMRSIFPQLRSISWSLIGRVSHNQA